MKEETKKQFEYFKGNLIFALIILSISGIGAAALYGLIWLSENYPHIAALGAACTAILIWVSCMWSSAGDDMDRDRREALESEEEEEPLY